MISVSSFMRTPILRRRACVNASVFDMDREKTSEAAIVVKGTSEPSVCAIPQETDLAQEGMEEVIIITDGNGGLACRRWSGEQHGAPSNSALLDHLEDHTRGLPGLGLTDHALRVCARF